MRALPSDPVPWRCPPYHPQPNCLSPAEVCEALASRDDLRKPQATLSKIKRRRSLVSSTGSRSHRGRSEERAEWASDRLQAQPAEKTAMTKSLGRGFATAGSARREEEQPLVRAPEARRCLIGGSGRWLTNTRIATC